MAHAKGLRDRRVMTRYAGAQRDPAAAQRLRRAVRERGRRPRLHRVHLQLSRASATRCSRPCSATTTRWRRRCSLVLSVCVIVANFIMDILNFVLDPRLRHELMSQLEPVALDASLELAAAAPRQRAAALPRSRLARAPARATRSRGIGPDHGRVRRDRRADRAAASRSRDPNDFNLLAARQAPSLAPPLRHDRPGQRHLLAGRLGARRSLLLGARRRRARDRASPRSSASPPPTRAASSTTSSTS